MQETIVLLFLKFLLTSFIPQLRGARLVVVLVVGITEQGYVVVGEVVALYSSIAHCCKSIAEH